MKKYTVFALFKMCNLAKYNRNNKLQEFKNK